MRPVPPLGGTQWRKRRGDISFKGISTEQKNVFLPPLGKNNTNWEFPAKGNTNLILLIYYCQNKLKLSGKVQAHISHSLTIGVEIRRIMGLNRIVITPIPTKRSDLVPEPNLYPFREFEGDTSPVF